MVEPREQRSPLVVILAWAEPGADLGQRLMKALDKSVAEQIEQGGFPPQRYDIEVAGHKVVHLSLPELGTKPFPQRDPMEMSPAEREAYFQQMQHWDQQESKPIVTDRTNVMLTRLGGRMIVAITPPQSSEQVWEMSPEEREKIDWHEVTSVEQATGVAARFLQAHDGEDGPFVQQVRSAPGLAATTPEGMQLLEAYVNPPALVRLGEQYAKQQDTAELGKTMEVLRRLGLTKLGPVALNVTLDGTTLRDGMFVSAPSPRGGILDLLATQPALPAEPPAWVSKDVLSYAQFSADLGQIYKRVREMVIAEGGQSAQQKFNQAEAMVQMQTGMSLLDILNSFGHRHMLVGFESRMVDMQVPDWSKYNGGGPNGQGMPPMKTIKQPQNRMAFVWQLRNVGVWKQLFQMIGQYAAMAPPEAVKQVEEQGFTGWRIKQEPVEMGLFLGRGYLVLAQGQDVASPTLAMLRNPPEGDAALRRSDVYARATELLPAREGLIYSIGDYNRSLKQTSRLILESMKTGVAMNPEGANDIEWIERLIPSEEELDGLMGAGVGQLYVTDDGFVVESALELQPAE